MATSPDDIIREILWRLDVEDLLRHRCVSKPWCSLIDSPDFIKRHLSHSLKTNTHLSLVLRRFFSVNLDSLDENDEGVGTAHRLNRPRGVGTEILGSCNGLLALLNDVADVAEIRLCNPSTRKSQMLPVTEIELRPSCFFDQTIVYGLGYDPISDDYKLVRIVQFRGEFHGEDSFHSEVKVYSLKTNSWRRIKEFPYYLEPNSENGILANNALHWVVSKKPNAKSFVGAFDLGSEEYRVVSLSDCLDGEFHMHLKALGDCLCMIACYWGDLDIWMMKEYGVKESWTKLLSLNSSSEFGLPLSYSKNGDKVLFNQNPVTLVWYDVRRKRVNNVRIRGAPSLFEVEMLVRSLVPLNGNVNGNGD